MPLKVNQPAPDFELPSTSGNIFHLNNYKGEALILYFYPKDFTPGCNREACAFRDQWDFFKNLKVNVIGISTDSIAEHNKFIKTHHLPFQLLSDKEAKVTALYKAQMPLFKTANRVTYLLDKNHMIIATYTNLFKAELHVEKMINKLKEDL